MESFARGRDFAAWIVQTPREVSTGGRQQLGRITKMGQRDLRRLLVLGAMAVDRTPTHCAILPATPTALLRTTKRLRVL